MALQITQHITACLDFHFHFQRDCSGARNSSLRNVGSRSSVHVVKLRRITFGRPIWAPAALLTHDSTANQEEFRAPYHAAARLIQFRDFAALSLEEICLHMPRGVAEARNNEGGFRMCEDTWNRDMMTH